MRDEYNEAHWYVWVILSLTTLFKSHSGFFLLLLVLCVLFFAGRHGPCWYFGDIRTTRTQGEYCDCYSSL